MDRRVGAHFEDCSLYHHSSTSTADDIKSDQEGVQVKYDITDEDTVTDPPRQEPKYFYENQTKINRTHLSVQNLEMTMWTDNE